MERNFNLLSPELTELSVHQNGKSAEARTPAMQKGFLR